MASALPAVDSVLQQIPAMARQALDDDGWARRLAATPSTGSSGPAELVVRFVHEGDTSQVTREAAERGAEEALRALMGDWRLRYLPSVGN
jgi:hypothetical protein